MLDATRFNEAVLGRQLVRREDETHCRHRIFPRHEHGNSNGNIHGGVTLAMVDVAMFSTMYLLRGIDTGRSVTLDVYVCNFGGDHSARAQALLAELMALFKPAQVEQHQLVRGQIAVDSRQQGSGC